MTDMDWPITEESPARRDEPAPRRSRPAQSSPARDPGSPGGRRPRPTRPRTPSRPPLTPAAVALSLGGLAILLLLIGSIYGSTRRGEASVTEPLPHVVAVDKAVVSLPPPNLLKPLSPEEAAKENAERPFVTRPDAPAGRFVLRADADSKTRALDCLTQAVYYEAAGEGADGGRAVAQVVLNRMKHPGYPASVCGVIYQGSDRLTGCQFTFTCDGSLLRAPVASLWARSRKIAEEALAGKVFGPVGHATHYHADYVLPYWADSLDKSVQIGRHIFYRFRSTAGDSRAFFQRYAGTEPQLVQPIGAVILPPLSPTDELASALVSDAIKKATPDVEKAAAASAPILADAARATLLADGEAAVKATRKPTQSSDCSSGGGRKILPMGATNMRAGAGASTC